MVAVVLPNWRVFLHVLGSIVLVGSVGAVVVLAIATKRRPGHSALLSRLAFRTLLFAVIPAWFLMRVPAQLVVDREYPHDSPTWVGIGFSVSEGVGVVILASAVVAYLSAKRGGVGRLATTLALLAPIQLAALAVAWWAMTTRPS
ncbi:MAG TPA: hypothetical protein VIU81_08370 [Gaiellaceae bacterium]